MAETLNRPPVTLENFDERLALATDKSKALEILKWTDSFLKETYEKSIKDNVLYVIERTLELVRKFELRESGYHLNMINRLGLLCHMYGNYNQAIPFYLLGLLQSDDKRRSTFNHNIADAMMSLGNVDDSLIFFNKAIKHRTPKDSNSELLSKQDTVYLDLMYHFIAVLRADKMDEARQIYEEVKEIEPAVFNFGFLGKTAKMIWFYKNDMPDIALEYHNKAHEILRSHKQNPHDVYQHNVHFLDYCTDLTDEKKEETLKENIKVSRGHLLKSFAKDSIIELIRLYENRGDEENMKHWLLYLYEFEKTEKDHIMPRLNTLLIEEFNHYFKRINDINKTINKQKDELQNITYILSHDLKTPLRTINSFTKVIERKILSDSKEDLDQDFNFIRNATSNIYELIEDLGELNSIDKDDGKMEHIDLNNILDEVKESITLFIKQKNAIIKKNDTLPRIRGKRSDFIILFQNLIENGIKYNDSNQPFISISTLAENGKMCIEFRDNGIGFDPQYEDQIFGFFKRLHTKESYDGTGFGLGICRKIMNKYKGEISAESKPNEGSTFKVLFPEKSCYIDYEKSSNEVM